MKVRIEQLQPSERVLSERKLARTRWLYDCGLFKPEIIITPFEKRYAVVDGNHTAYAAYERGLFQIEAEVEQRQIQHIPSIATAGITGISDLSDKILTHNEWRKIFPECNNFEDALSDDVFFSKHPELEKYCFYRKIKTF
ncbi:MAG: hypothetical protein WC755_01625 [Candidatus Woesearchaeota archaeon]|jgi:hypothetical protein